MASLHSLPWLLTNNTTIPPSLLPFSRNKNQSPKSRKRGNYIPISKASASDNSNSEQGNSDNSPSKFDRRDVLFGLGGFYGAAALSGSHSSSLADPVITPNIKNCGKSTVLDPSTGQFVEFTNCCPPSPDKIRDFVFPDTREPHVRKAAHLLTDRQLAKFEDAVSEMKKLDANDPRNFLQQANIHCTYCNDAYDQEGYPDTILKVHGNWLFFPFHRCYLYFYERILKHLIDDPTFTLPFWNWDNPDGGMQMPFIYNNSTKSPLYDALRNQDHLPPTLVDLNYSRKENPPYDLVEANLRLMYRQMFTNSKTAEQFFGKPIKAGEEAEKGAGSIERTPHNNIHLWVGDPRSKIGEDMGNFYSAGRDVLFYGHHANVDRMWTLWKESGKGNHREFRSYDWLDSSFVFYDEYKNAVRIKVRDCLDTKKLGYVYQDVPICWKHAKPVPIPPNKLKRAKKLTSKKDEGSIPLLSFPLVLNSTVTAVVERPKKSRSRKEKEEEDEILVIEGIQFDRGSAVHFDVIINVLDDENDTVNPGNTEFAGSFSSVPHLHKHKKGDNNQKTELSLGITELLEDLDCDGDDTVFVTLIPKLGEGKVTIDGIKIKFLSLN